MTRALRIAAPHTVPNAPARAPTVARDDGASMPSGRSAAHGALPKSLFRPVIVFIVLPALSIQLLSSGFASRAYPSTGLLERSQHEHCGGATPVGSGNSNGESCCPGSLLPKTLHIQISAERKPAFLFPISSFLSGISTPPPLPPPIQELGRSSLRADLPFSRNWISLGLDAQPVMEDLVKKVIVILTAMVVGLGLGACSSNYAPTPSPSSVQTGPRGPGSPKDALYHHPDDPNYPAQGRPSGGY